MQCIIANPGAAEPVGEGGMGGGRDGGVCPHFLKVKKVLFFWAKVPHLKNEKNAVRDHIFSAVITKILLKFCLIKKIFYQMLLPK